MTQNTLSLSGWDFSYFAFLMVVGSACHFFYQLLGKPLWAGLIFPTNESTFQHLKLLLIPSVVFFIIQYFTAEMGNYGFFTSRFAGVLFGMLGTCVFFYTYTGIIGDNFLPLDIFSFAFGVGVTIFTYRIFDDSAVFDFKFSNIIGVFGFALLIIFFGILSVYPPQIGIFFDPASNSYAPLLPDSE
ncbi:MAG: DUF6512 family protein [Bacillota bacterium]